MPLQLSFKATLNVLRTNAVPSVALSLYAGPLSLRSYLHTYASRSSRLQGVHALSPDQGTIVSAAPKGRGSGGKKVAYLNRTLLVLSDSGEPVECFPCAACQAAGGLQAVLDVLGRQIEQRLVAHLHAFVEGDV